MTRRPRRRRLRHARLVQAGLVGLGGWLALASSGSQNPSSERLIREPPPARPERSARAAPPRRQGTQTPYAPCPAPRGSIYRDQLQRILARGPGVFLRGIDVQMVPRSSLPRGARLALRTAGDGSRGSIFGGWRIRRFHPGDPCLGRSDLQPGDVVYSINGRPLRRPEDLVALWASSRQNPRLVVRLFRRGHPLVFVVRILPDRTRPRDAIDGGQAR